jgi:hypothetical protein
VRALVSQVGRPDYEAIEDGKPARVAAPGRQSSATTTALTLTRVAAPERQSSAATTLTREGDGGAAAAALARIGHPRLLVLLAALSAGPTHRTVLTSAVRGLPDPLGALDALLDALEAHGMGLHGAWVSAEPSGLAALRRQLGAEAEARGGEADTEAGELGEDGRAAGAAALASLGRAIGEAGGGAGAELNGEAGEFNGDAGRASVALEGGEAGEVSELAGEGGEAGEAPQLEGGEAAGASELNSEAGGTSQLSSEAGGGVDEGSEAAVSAGDGGAASGARAVGRKRAPPEPAGRVLRVARPIRAGHLSSQKRPRVGVGRAYQADVPAVGEAAVERSDEPVCAICTDPLVGELWTCDECEQAVHRACMAAHLKVVRSQACLCALPGLCSCRPAPTCPTRARKCGTSGCTLRDGHGGLCSSVPPVSTDAHGRARRSAEQAAARVAAAAAERAAFNAALLAAEPRRRWPDHGTARVALSAAPAEALCRFLRARDGAKLVVGGRAYTGYHDYRATAAAEAGRRHDANEQVKFTLLLDDVDHARDHLPGLDALAHGAQCSLPEPMDLLHGHVLDQTSEHTQFGDHQDTEENRKKGARRADREVVYTVVLKLSRGGDTAMRVLGCEPVAYEAAPGTGVCFRSELWHRTERASAGTVKLTLFFGRRL